MPAQPDQPRFAPADMPRASNGATTGGIDLGGTKIEARLFDAQMQTLETRRLPTPAEDFTAFVKALAAQVRWLEETSGLGAALPVGIGLPGLIDPESGLGFAANIPITGQNLPAALTEALGRPVPLLNDCQAFALSEAHGGAGTGARRVIGLIMGTGIGAGLAQDGRAGYRANGSALEVGHIGLPSHALQELRDRLGVDLALRDCGCGRRGCFETCLSGPGLSWLARQYLGAELEPADLAQRAGDGERAAEVVLQIWAHLAGELLLTLQLAHDPDCIVLGGGLSQIPGVELRLAAALERVRLGSMRAPKIAIAQHGDSSGARGAALHALAQARDI
ncbi:ROK family protein [Alloyangia pacifica]|uniref:ROK family protein n=1 Tax=Alloyangia pacifica TaxID=311180 RepID=UPI001CD1DA34|nr:ROK family protein [Alloyangia pacifica]MCA0996742.1 ROK family protein [Alloyangia pacifica]